MNKLLILTAACAVTIFSGCTVTAEGVDGEMTGAVSAPLVTYGRGAAWVLSSGAIGNSWTTAGSVVSTRLATGQYEIKFEGMPYVVGRATAQVVAYNTNAHCKLFSNPLGNGARTFLNVLCFSPSGASVDAAFAVWMDMRQGGDTASQGGYAFVSGTATSNWYSSAGSTDEWKPTSTWDTVNKISTVTFPGLGFLNAGIHVTAVGPNARRCNVIDWDDVRIRVKCYDSSGAAVSSSFTISYEAGADFPSHVGGHALVFLTNIVGWGTHAVPYRTCDTSTFTPGRAGTRMRITQTNADVASGGSWTNILPMVTSFGESSHYCNLHSWTVFTGSGTATVDVQCYDNAGTAIDTAGAKFSLSITNKAVPRGC